MSEKKTRRINYRLTESEYKEVESFCKKNEITVSTFLGRYINKTVDVNKDYLKEIKNEIELKKIHELSKIGNNINQIAKIMNIMAKGKGFKVSQNNIKLVEESSKLLENWNKIKDDN